NGCPSVHSLANPAIFVFQVDLGRHHARAGIFGCGDARDLALELFAGKRIELEDDRIAGIGVTNFAVRDMNDDAHAVGSLDGQERELGGAFTGGTHEVSGEQGAVGDDAVEGSVNGGVGELDLRLLLFRLGDFHLGLGFADVGLG